MDLANVSVPLAAAAGAASFLSPCVLPLVPAYLALLARSATGPAASDPRPWPTGSGVRWRVLRGAFGFVLGLGLFCLTFFYALDRILQPWKSVVTPILGIAVILLGLSFMGFLRLPWLRRDVRHLPSNLARGGLLAGFLLGLGLAAGWSPCIGPVLGAVLTSGISQGTTARGLYLMAAYCVGLGLPFLLAAIFFDRLGPALRAVNRHQRVISLLGGVVVVAMGTLVSVNHFAIFNTWLSSHLPGFFQDPFNL